jgi:hypothetical protein
MVIRRHGAHAIQVGRVIQPIALQMDLDIHSSLFRALEIARMQMPRIAMEAMVGSRMANISSKVLAQRSGSHTSLNSITQI